MEILMTKVVGNGFFEKMLFPLKTVSGAMLNINGMDR